MVVLLNGNDNISKFIFLKSIFKCIDKIYERKKPIHLRKLAVFDCPLYIARIIIIFKHFWIQCEKITFIILDVIRFNSIRFVSIRCEFVPPFPSRQLSPGSNPMRSVFNIHWGTKYLCGCFSVCVCVKLVAVEHVPIINLHIRPMEKKKSQVWHSNEGEFQIEFTIYSQFASQKLFQYFVERFFSHLQQPEKIGDYWIYYIYIKNATASEPDHLHCVVLFNWREFFCKRQNSFKYIAFRLNFSQISFNFIMWSKKNMMDTEQQTEDNMPFLRARINQSPHKYLAISPSAMKYVLFVLENMTENITYDSLKRKRII